jgi:hypothetical protein
MWRKIQSEGLANEYGSRNVMSWPTFMPPSEIPSAFDQVKLLLPENAAGVAEYFETNYIRRRARNLRNRSSHHTAPLGFCQ